MITRGTPASPADWIDCRKRNGLSLPAIAEATKICPRYLEAIEGGKFDKLPGGAYSVSYIRQYAQAIRYDEDRLLAYYQSALQAEAAAHPIPLPPKTWLDRFRDCLRGLTPLQSSPPSLERHVVVQFPRPPEQHHAPKLRRKRV